MRFGWKTTLIAACIAAAAASPAPAAAPETYGIASATFPEPGVMAAGQPTGEQIQLLAEDGYRTVIDLRPAEEPRGFDETEAARENGLAYVNIPVTLATLDQATLDRFLAAMEKAERPLILHCGSSNRVGGLVYAWLVLEKGVTPAEAMKRAKAAGLHQRELIDRVTKLVAERRKQPPRSDRPGSSDGNPRRLAPHLPDPPLPPHSRPPGEEGDGFRLVFSSPLSPGGRV